MDIADELDRIGRSAPTEAWNDVPPSDATPHSLWAEVRRLRAALAVYADPSFYHACSFMFDRPTGGFDEDFSFNEEYQRDMPGKLARDTLGPNV